MKERNQFIIWDTFVKLKGSDVSQELANRAKLSISAYLERARGASCSNKNRNYMKNLAKSIIIKQISFKSYCISSKTLNSTLNLKIACK